MTPNYVYLENAYEVSGKFFQHQHSRRVHLTTIEIDQCWTDKDTFQFFDKQKAVSAYYTYAYNDNEQLILQACIFWN